MGKAWAVVCMAIVIVITTIIFWKLIQGRPVPQNESDSFVVVWTSQPLPNICNALNETYDKTLFVENNIDRLKLNQTSSDVRLLHGKWFVGAHKIILAAHSDTFEQIFTKDSEIDNKIGEMFEFVVPDRDAGSFPALLDFIYKRKVPSGNFIDLKNLLFVAERYQVQALKCVLERHFQSLMDINNVGNILSASIVANATFLKIAASHFLLDNLSPVLSSDTWKKVSKDNPSIYATAIESSGGYSKNASTSTCSIKCASDGFDSATIINRLKRYFITERFADAKLLLPNQTVFRVNRAMLIEQSSVWLGKFKLSDPSMNVALPFYTDPYAMKEFLIYMYSGWVRQLNLITNNLMILANEYEMWQLKNATENIISSRVDNSNVVEYFIIAEQAESSRLKKQLAEFFFTNRKEIIQTIEWQQMKEKHPDVIAKILLELA